MAVVVVVSHIKLVALLGCVDCSPNLFDTNFCLWVAAVDYFFCCSTSEMGVRALLVLLSLTVASIGEVGSDWAGALTELAFGFV